MMPLQFVTFRTLKRLRDANENRHARGTFAGCATWVEKIPRSKLQLDPEALEAVTFGMELTLPDQQQPLLDLKAAISKR